MFPTRKRIMLLHLSGNVIRTTADHPFFVAGKGWMNAADLRPGDPLLAHDGKKVPVEGISDSGEQEVVYHLHPGEHSMPDQPQPNEDTGKPIIGFVAGTPILTLEGHKPIEQLRPGDIIQTRPDDGQGDEPGDPGDDCDHDPRRWERN